MIYYQSGSENTIITPDELKHGIFSALEKLGRKKKVLAIPPDQTRIHSRAGDITTLLYRYYGENLRDILPALGTHVPMSSRQIEEMFGDVPQSLFRGS